MAADVFLEQPGILRICPAADAGGAWASRPCESGHSPHNERRVEAELLELLDTRKDAELKDVLELRTHIGQVREQIERLVAQQQHLAHLVSLATVLVIIRHDGEPAKAEATGIGAYFADVMKSAWERGITGLADSIAWIAATLLGGLIWWTIAAIALWLAWRKFVAMRARQGTQGLQ